MKKSNCVLIFIYLALANMAQGQQSTFGEMTGTPTVQKCVGEGQTSLSIQKMTLDAGSETVFCEGVNRVRIFNLTMQEGALIRIPKRTPSFELRIGDGTFYGGNGVLASPSYGGQQNGTNISMTVDRAWLNFPLTTRKFQPREWSESIQRLFKQGHFFSQGIGLLIQSVGDQGSAGIPGGTGVHAVESECGGFDGTAAGPGGRGGTGGQGYVGGDITVEITLAKGQRKIENLDVQLLSLGGLGGFGGIGGPGGNGAPSFVCKGLGLVKVGRRSGFDPGPEGPLGALGSVGRPGKVHLKVLVTDN